MKRFLTFFGTLCQCFSFVQAQLEEKLDEKGDVFSVVITNHPSWLAENSNLHRNPHLESVELINHDVTFNDISYLSSIQGLKRLTLGVAPEGVVAGSAALAKIEDFSNLVELNLCVGRLEIDDLSFLRKMEHLKSLSISSRYGEMLEFSDEFARMVGAIGLEKLSIGGIISDDQVQEICRNRNITELDIFSNDLTDASLSFVSHAENLRSLRLVSRKITNKSYALIAKLRNIESVEISSEGLSLEGAASLSNLPKLSRLWLNVSGDPGKSFSSLASIKKLEHLRIEGCEVFDNDMAPFRGHPFLRYVYIPNSRITEDSFDVIQSLMRIEVFVISDSPNGKELEFQAKIDAIIEKAGGRK